MSMLLDAVRRARQSDTQDPALTPVMPTTRTRRRPWHWGVPLVTLAVGAALGYLTLPQPQTQVPAADLAQPPMLTLAERVALPIPTPLASLVPEPEPEVQVTEITVDGISTPIEVTRDVPAESQAQPTTQAQPEPEVANPALMAALEQALADMGAEGDFTRVNEPEPVIEEGTVVLSDGPETAEPAEPQPIPSSELPKLGQMPWAFQKRIPDVEITAHVYATDPDSRWLRANGRELQEGDEAAPGLTIAEIMPSEVVLEMDGERFRVPALGSL
ncbi:general secretion pathway protein GspB [Marinobacter hydrocarbonoclasticus]|nr:general secretion pathway protein GspB [Marinobacter nauticus]